MALENESTGMVMPVAPTGYGFGGCNNGFGFGGNFDSLIVLFLFAAMFGGFGNNGFGGNGNGAYPWMLASNTDNGVRAGFNQAATDSALNGIQQSITAGFSGVEVASCNRTIAELERSFNAQTATTAALSGISAQLAQCCCENRAATADLKYTVATEACADRNAISNALRDVLTATTAQNQRILDQLCSDKIDAKNEKIADLERQLTMANLAASQTAQTAKLIANNEAQTTALEQYLAPVPRPAWIVQNPNCCSANTGCGCGSF